MRHTLYIMAYIINYISRQASRLHAGIAASLLLMLLFTACQDDLGVRSNPFDDVKPGGIQVSIDNTRPYSMTRAKLIDSPGISMDVEWEAKDAIGVYSTKGTNLQYTLAAEDITSNNIGTFRNEAGTPEGEFSAYFPYEPTASGTLESGLTLTMPDKQMQDLDGAKPMPDDLASAMVGKGTGGNVTLHSVHAILKIGYVALDSVDVMKSITFRDLSGRPVSGRYTVTLDDKGYPVAAFPTSGGSEADGIITLECDSNYSTVTDSDLRTFFIVVPAREYPQGFELTFHLKSGKSESKTIGKLAGKTLERGQVYPVGEVSIVREGSYTMEFNGEGFMMTEDQLALIENLWPLDYHEFYSRDVSNYASKLSDMEALVQSGPSTFAMVVDKRLDIHEDMTIVINRVSEALPYGLIAKVTRVDKQGDNHLYVELQRYAHVEGAFKKLQMGATQYTADGTPIDEKPMDLGLDDQNLLAAPENPEVEEYQVPYDSIDLVPDSIPEYLYDEEVADEDSLVTLDEEGYATFAPRRRARGSHTDGVRVSNAAPRRIYRHGSNNYTLLNKSFQLKDHKYEKGSYSNSANLTFGVKASLGTYISVDIDDMHLNHLFLRLTPAIDLDLVAKFNWTYSKEGTLKDAATKNDKSWDLGHLYFSPIAVGPLVFVPECITSVGANFTAQMELEAKWHYRAAVELELKYYRLYKEGEAPWWKWGDVDYEDHFEGHIRNKSDDPSWSRLIPEMAASLDMRATGSFYFNFGVGVYGLIHIDAYANPRVTARMHMETAVGPYSSVFKNWNGYLSLDPELGYGLRVGSKYVPLGEMEFNPLWRRHFFPDLKSIKTTGNMKHDLGAYKINAKYPDRNYVSGKYVTVPIEAELENQLFSDMQLRWKVQYGTTYPYLFCTDAGVYSKTKDKLKVRLPLRLNAQTYFTGTGSTIADHKVERSLFPTWNNTDIVWSYYQGDEINHPWLQLSSDRSHMRSNGSEIYVTLEGRYGNGAWWPLPWVGSKTGEVRLGHWLDEMDVVVEKDKEDYPTGIVSGKHWGIYVVDDQGYWRFNRDTNQMELQQRE